MEWEKPHFNDRRRWSLIRRTSVAVAPYWCEARVCPGGQASLYSFIVRWSRCRESVSPFSVVGFVLPHSAPAANGIPPRPLSKGWPAERGRLRMGKDVFWIPCRTSDPKSPRCFCRSRPSVGRVREPTHEQEAAAPSAGGRAQQKPCRNFGPRPSTVGGLKSIDPLCSCISLTSSTGERKAL